MFGKKEFFGSTVQDTIMTIDMKTFFIYVVLRLGKGLQSAM